MIKIFSFFIFFISLLWSCSCSHELNSVQLFNKVIPSVVGIEQNEQMLIQSLTTTTSTIVAKRFSGTGFIYKKTKNYDLVMTAAHLCIPEPQDYEIPPILEEKFPVASSFRAINVKIRARLYDGQMVKTIIIGYNAVQDICVVMIKPTKFDSLSFADQMILLGQEVNLVGFPGGFQFFKPTTADFVKGFLVGTSQLPTTGPLQNRFTIPMSNGLSGSPITNNFGEVVGMSTQMSISWHHGTFSPKFVELLKGVADADALIFKYEAEMLASLYSGSD